MTIRKTLVATAIAALVLPRATGAQGLYEDTATWKFGLTGWTVDFHTGASGFGRFLLEAPSVDPDAFTRTQREVTAGFGFAIGAGVGATVLPRTQVRLGYTHTATDLDYRDDTGSGATALDADGIGDLASDIVSLELMRYLVNENSAVVPFANAGFMAAWWGLDDASPGVLAAGGSTQFRWGSTATLGVQFRVTSAFGVRLEAVRGSIGNPFRGSESFTTVDGLTIDEPNRVSKTDYRLALSYRFGRSARAAEAATARRNR